MCFGKYCPRHDGDIATNPTGKEWIKEVLKDSELQINVLNNINLKYGCVSETLTL